MVASVRFAEKFTNLAVTTTYTFPLEMYEYTNSQDFNSNLMSVAGADYPYDPQGNNPWPMSEGSEEVKFKINAATNLLINAAYDTLSSTLRIIGLGKLWTNDSVNSRRWCYAKLAKRPTIAVGPKLPYYPEVTCEFIRMSDWFAETATASNVLCNVGTTNFNITNAGNVPAKFIVFRLRANTAGGFTNPIITNTTNGMTISTTRDSISVSSEWKVNTEEGSIEFSDTDGASYTADYALATIPATQVGIIQLEPGVNAMQVVIGGTPDSSFEWSFYAQYA